MFWLQCAELMLLTNFNKYSYYISSVTCCGYRNHYSFSECAVHLVYFKLLPFSL